MPQFDYGMFIMPFHPPSKSLATCYAEDLELIKIAEQLGFKEFWIGEHHTMKYENVVMPELLIARALAETSTIRLGGAPVCLQQHHPAQVAGRLAQLDHMSGGRLNLCFGAGSVTADLEMFGVDPRNNSKMVCESLEMILHLWQNDPPYHLEGEFWEIHLEKNVDDETLIGFVPRPLQDPLPEILMPGMSRNSSTMRYAGANGHVPFCHCLVTANVIADNLKTYEEAAIEAGRKPDRSKYRVAKSIFLADDREEAQQKARGNSLGQNFEYIGRLFDKGLGRQIYKRDLDMRDEDCNLDFLMTEQIIAGDVDYALERLEAFIEETGEFGTLCLMSYDWDDKAAWLRSMELFAKELMPRLNAKYA